jgi:TolB protein
VVYAHGVDDGVDLYTVPVSGGGGRRLSVGRGSDNVSPSFSPDGRRIAFMSGRAGHPEIYTMDADGTNVDLLTPLDVGESAYRASPDWSPDGRLVAFQSRIGSVFQLLTVNLRDRGLRQLTSDGRNEDPSWAPDGRHLVFVSDRSGVRQLWVLDIESGRTRQLTHGGAVRMPAWSPRLGGN